MSGTSGTPPDPIDLVIFDSDGVLVDSEHLALAVLAEHARAAGADMTVDEAVRLFRGRKITDCVLEIERRSGRPTSSTFIDEVRHATAQAFERDLLAVEGVHAALDAITLPICVASNGPLFKLTQTLTLTDLLDRFEGRIFSAYEVGSWKPEPGLFLHAAKTMGADPTRCVVVEDSVPGVRAALAAGMRVLGYAGAGSDVAAELAGAGAEVFHQMADLSARLTAPAGDSAILAQARSTGR
ncbi:HAD family hydrolase [soil metagenome]